MRFFRFVMRLLCAAGLAFAAAAPALAQPNLVVPYVPTPDSVIAKMLEMAKVGKKDVVYDLGCGDGRIVITAAEKYGARGVGIDLNPQRIEEAEANRVKSAARDKVKFVVGDLFESNFADATVVTLYLLPDVNVKLRPELWKQLKVGTRVVSHAYHMGDEWLPERTEMVDGRPVYLWTITEKQKKALAAG